MVAFVTALQAEQLRTISRRTPPTEDEERDFIAKAEANGRAFFLLAFAGDDVVGMLDLWAGERPQNRHMASFGVSVAKPWRGCGIARRLIEAAVGEAKSWPDLCRIELECVTHHEGAIRLYESLGFVVEGRKRKATDLGNGPEDMLVMALVW